MGVCGPRKPRGGSSIAQVSGQEDFLSEVAGTPGFIWPKDKVAVTWAVVTAHAEGLHLETGWKPWLGTSVTCRTLASTSNGSAQLLTMGPEVESGTPQRGSWGLCPPGLMGGGLSTQPSPVHLFSLGFSLNLFTCISAVCPFPSTGLAVLFLRIWAGTRAEQGEPN